MSLFMINTQADSALVEIDTNDKNVIKDILKDYLKEKDYYYVDGLLAVLREKGFNVQKVVPIKINWWEIQPFREMEDIVKYIINIKE